MRLLWILMDFYKVRQTFFLSFSGIIAYLVASANHFQPFVFALLIASLFLTISGTTGINMILDRDIDAIMFRTRSRVLPKNEITVRTGIILSLIPLLLGLYIAYMINIWVLFAGILGFAVDIILYTYFLKRKSIFNIVLGSIAGGAPAFGGWVAFTGHPTIEAVLFLLLIAQWAILHIWYISSYYIEDYKKAKIPMLPVVYGYTITARASLGIVITIFLNIFALYLTGAVGIIGLILSLFPTIYLARLIVSHWNTYEKPVVWRIYKFLNMYLGSILIVFFIEKLIF